MIDQLERPPMIATAEITSAQLLAKLGTLRDKAGPLLYERGQLLLRLERDQTWLTEHFQSYDQAIRALEEDYLGDVCGAVTLREFLIIAEAIPDADEWKACKYNLRALRIVANNRRENARREAEERRKRERQQRNEVASDNVIKDRIEASEAVMEKIHQTAATISEENERLRRENADLRRKNQDLEIANAQLRDFNERLKKKLKTKGEAVEA